MSAFIGFHGFELILTFYAALFLLVLLTRLAQLPKPAVVFATVLSVPAYDVLFMPALSALMRSTGCTADGNMLIFDPSVPCDGHWEHRLRVFLVSSGSVVFAIGPSAVFLCFVQPYQSTASPGVFFIPRSRGFTLLAKFVVVLGVWGGEFYEIPILTATLTCLSTVLIAVHQLLIPAVLGQGESLHPPPLPPSPPPLLF